WLCGGVPWPLVSGHPWAVCLGGRSGDAAGGSYERHFRWLACLVAVALRGGGNVPTGERRLLGCGPQHCRSAVPFDQASHRLGELAIHSGAPRAVVAVGAGR